MNPHLTSSVLKFEVLRYFRWVRHYDVVATEVGGYGHTFADVIAGKKGKEVIEIEIKASISDFTKEFETKNKKHAVYLNKSFNTTAKVRNVDTLLIPNKMYYAVAKQHTAVVLDVLKGSPYGVLEVNPADKTNPVMCVKTAVLLSKPFPITLYEHAIQRATSELVTLYEEVLYTNRH